MHLIKSYQIFTLLLVLLNLNLNSTLLRYFLAKILVKPLKLCFTHVLVWLKKK